MKRFISLCCICSAMLLLSTACIDNRYDMSKLSLKLALGGDSLSIPLLSNGKIFLGEALDEFVEDSIEGLEEDSIKGGYTFEMGDHFSYVLDSAAKAEMGLTELGIEDQVFEEAFEVEGLDASATRITIEGMSQKEVINLDMDHISLDNLTLPKLEVSESFNTDFSQYQLSDEQRQITIDPLSIEKGNLLGNASLPAALEAFANNLPHEEISLILPSNTLNIALNEEMSLQIKTPGGISGIEDIILQQLPQAATLSISIQLENADQFLTAGEIIPDLSIFPTSIFNFASSNDINEGHIVFGAEDVMNKDNQYRISKNLAINSLNISGNPENGAISFKQEISANGDVKVENVKYYADEITKIKELAFKVEVAFNNIVIESMSFVIDGESTAISGENDINISNDIPEQIASIQTILAEEGSQIIFDIKGSEALAGLKDNLSLESFSLTFPKAFRFAAQEGLDQTNNTYSLPQQAFNPAEGLHIALTLNEIDMSQIPVENQKLNWNDQVSYQGTLKVHGKINTADLPTGQAGFDVKAQSTLQLKDIIANTNKISHSLDNIKFVFDETINSPLKEITAIKTATLEDGANINIMLDLPELPLAIVAEDLCIALPKMMEFASHPNLKEGNILSIDGEIPENINLQLKKLNINKPFVDGILSLSDSVVVSGGVAVNAGETSAKALAEALKNDIRVDFSLSDMVLSDIGASISGISYQMSDVIAFEESIEVPQEILRIDSILLDDEAQINISLLAENLPELDAPITMNVSLRIPEIFLLEGEDIKDKNIWQFESEVINGKMIEKTLKVRGLNLSNMDLSSGLVNLKEQIEYDVTVLLAASDINSGDLSDQPIKLSTKASISHIELNKVFGVIDPQIENISESISLADLPEFLRDPETTSLEINPVIQLSAKSNISIPLVIDAQLKPITNGLVDESRIQNIHIELPRATSVEEVKEHHFWVAANETDMPEGYTFIALNVNDILKNLPDSLCFNLQVNTDTEVQHEIDLNVDYLADLDYQISIPIAFGENSYFNISDTLEMDMSEYGEYFDYIGECVELFGEIESSLPLNLTAHLQVLDENMEVIEMENDVRLAVKAGKSDGSATLSPVNIKLDNSSHRLDQARYFLLNFKLNSDADIANTPLSPDNYLQAKLKLRVVGGFIVDVDEL